MHPQGPGPHRPGGEAQKGRRMPQVVLQIITLKHVFVQISALYLEHPRCGGIDEKACEYIVMYFGGVYIS